jgi:hypothetical protein
MFRLRLNAQDGQKAPRRIVLEGRIGFSRLTCSLLPKSQMFVNPRGDALISGKPGGSMLIETETLRARNFAPSNGLAVVGAEFSPDGGRVALTLLDAPQKKSATVLTDNQLGSIQQLPAGTQFLRWLGKDEILLKGDGHLIRHPLVAGKDHIFDPPAGWSQPAVSGNVIPGTDIQYLWVFRKVLSLSKRSCKALRQHDSAPLRTTFLCSAASMAKSVFGCNMD